MLGKTMEDDVVAGRSQWKPVAVLTLICQGTVLRGCPKGWQRLGGGTTLECSRGTVARNQWIDDE